MKIIAIMPTYARKTMALNAIRSVYEQTKKPDVFIVLDNGSRDGTKEVLENFLKQDAIKEKQIDFQVIRKEENLGASYGMQYLFKEALKQNADWIWVMDDDALAKPDALEKLMSSKAFQDPEAYILESKITDSENVWSAPNRPAKFNPATFDFNGIDANEDEPGAEVEVHTGGYCGWFVRKECFLTYGFPKAELFFWFDDIEYVVRVSRKKRVILVMDSVVQHFATSLVSHEVRWPFRGPLPKIPYEHLGRYFYWYRNYLWFAKQWLGPASFFVFTCKHVVRGLSAPIVFSQEHKSSRWKVVLQASFDALTNRLGMKEINK